MAGRKTHVTHAVRPAHHDHFGLRQIDNPVVNVVQQAARAGNDDVTARIALIWAFFLMTPNVAMERLYIVFEQKWERGWRAASDASRVSIRS